MLSVLGPDRDLEGQHEWGRRQYDSDGRQVVSQQIRQPRWWRWTTEGTWEYWQLEMVHEGVVLVDVAGTRDD